MDDYKNVRQGWTITIAMLAFWCAGARYCGDRFISGFLAGGVLYSIVNAQQTLKDLRREIAWEKSQESRADRKLAD